MNQVRFGNLCTKSMIYVKLIGAMNTRTLVHTENFVSKPCCLPNFARDNTNYHGECIAGSPCLCEEEICFPSVTTEEEEESSANNTPTEPNDAGGGSLLDSEEEVVDDASSLALDSASAAEAASIVGVVVSSSSMTSVVGIGVFSTLLLSSSSLVV